MKDHHIMILICLGLLIGSAVTEGLYPPETPPSTLQAVMWNGFLFGVPVLLGGFLITGMRWIFMVSVLYGTIGLALDVATFVQSVTHPGEPPGFVLLVGVTGLLNFLLIVFGGRGFLRVC